MRRVTPLPAVAGQATPNLSDVREATPPPGTCQFVRYMARESRGACGRHRRWRAAVSFRPQPVPL